MKRVRQISFYHLIFERFSAKSHLLPLFICMMVFTLLSPALRAEEGFISAVEISAEFSNETKYAAEVFPRAIYTCSDDSVVLISLACFLTDPDMSNANIPSIVKLDSHGNLLWQRDFQSYGIYTFFNWLVGIGIDENDCVSFLTGKSFGDLYKYVVHVDAEGNVSHNKLNIGIENDYEHIVFSKALRHPSGDYLAFGEVAEHVNAQRDLVYMRFTPDATQISHTIIATDEDNFADFRAYDAAIEESGNILLGCKITADYNEILRLNLDGDILDSMPLNHDPSSFYGLYPVALSKSAESGHITATYFGIPLLPTEGNIVYVAHVTEDDIIHHTSSLSIAMPIYSMIEIEGDLFVTSLLEHYDPAPSLMRLNQADDYSMAWAWRDPVFSIQAWPEFVNYSQVDLLRTYHTMAKTLNNSIYIAGNQGLNKACVAKVLRSGGLPVEDDIAAPPIIKIDAYPNPMKEGVKIMLKRDADAPFNANAVEVFNIKGQRVRRLESSQDGASIWDGKDENGRACPTGIYLIRDEKGMHKPVKIVKMK